MWRPETTQKNGAPPLRLHYWEHIAQNLGTHKNKKPLQNMI